MILNPQLQLNPSPVGPGVTRRHGVQAQNTGFFSYSLLTQVVTGGAGQACQASLLVPSDSRALPGDSHAATANLNSWLSKSGSNPGCLSTAPPQFYWSVTSAMWKFMEKRPERGCRSDMHVLGTENKRITRSVAALVCLNQPKIGPITGGCWSSLHVFLSTAHPRAVPAGHSSSNGSPAPRRCETTNRTPYPPRFTTGDRRTENRA